MRRKELQVTVGGPENSQYVFPSLPDIGWRKGPAGGGGGKNKFKIIFKKGTKGIGVWSWPYQI